VVARVACTATARTSSLEASSHRLELHSRRSPGKSQCSSSHPRMGWMSCERMVISALEEKELPTVSSVGLLNESPRLVITVTLMRISVARACRVSLNARLIFLNQNGIYHCCGAHCLDVVGDVGTSEPVTFILAPPPSPFNSTAHSQLHPSYSSGPEITRTILLSSTISHPFGNLSYLFEDLRSIERRSHEFRESKLHSGLARIQCQLLANCLSLPLLNKSALPVWACEIMTEGRAKYWGKIEELEAERAESILEKGEKEKPRGIPFVNIKVADAPELRTVRESVEKVVLCHAHMVVERSTDCRAGSSRARNTMGYSIHAARLGREGTWYFERPGTRSRRAQCDGKITMGRQWCKRWNLYVGSDRVLDLRTRKLFPAFST
jgi:hypothetical protein